MASSPNRNVWTDARLATPNERFESLSVRDVLGWGVHTFGPDIVQATGFSPRGS